MRRDSNPRPTDYQSVALPLSYSNALTVRTFGRSTPGKGSADFSLQNTQLLPASLPARRTSGQRPVAGHLPLVLDPASGGVDSPDGTGILQLSLSASPPQSGYPLPDMPLLPPQRSPLAAWNGHDSCLLAPTRPKASLRNGYFRAGFIPVAGFM